MKDFKLKDVLISILIVSVSLFYFADKYFIPKGLETINILGVEIDSFGFVSLRTFIYFSKMKLLILFFSITWYLTCRHWWKSAILVIITIELFKLTTIFNENFVYIDEIEYITSLPITLPVITLLLLLSSKINNYRMSNEVRKALDNEIDDVFFDLNQGKLNELTFFRKRIKNAKKKSNFFDKKKYLDSIIEIRDEFYKS